MWVFGDTSDENTVLPRFFVIYKPVEGDGQTKNKNKMKKLMIALLAVVALAMASCSSGRYLGHSDNVNINQTQVVLSQNNFKVVKQVSKVVIFEQRYNFKKGQLKESAYAALLKEAKLEGSQTIVNVTFEEVQRLSGILIPKTQSAILVQGTVIEFTK